ncbi:UNKNOWN [Stylonychia lemnae]|uniref:Uncharacterized protein n=1 Tax=Stylonychia lemnae TaxID=5949 RepID=A0A078B5Y7_STYLE|nr:UNKNOWN [Stylonychia lemnae]|eukprot:CDW89641.1 UNKNOWN [Stylonychia lemnae]
MYGQPFMFTFKGQNKLGFDLAFGGYSDLDPRYGSIIATHNVRQRFKNKTTGLLEVKMAYEPLELVRCGQEYFNYENKNESAYDDVANLLCIKEKKYLSLGGAWTTNRLEEIQIVMKPCENKTSSKTICASESQILEYFSTFIEDRYFMPVQTNQQKGLVILVKKGFSNLNDDFFPFQSQNNKNFIFVDNFIQSTGNLDYHDCNCYTKIILRMDVEYEIYERKVYNFADLLSELGGIYSSLFAIGSIFVMSISQNLFYSQIIKDIYQIKESSQDFIGNFRKQTTLERKEDKNTIIDKLKNLNTLNQTQKTDASIRELHQFQDDEEEIKAQEAPSLLSRILFEIQNRLNVAFKIKNILKITLGLVTKNDLKMRKENQDFRQIYLFKKGVSKIDNEFDAISLLKLMKQVKLLSQVILNPTQRLLLGFQRKNVLDSDSSDANNSDEDDLKIINRMKSKSAFVKLMSLGKMKKKISEYLDETKGQFNEIDRRIFQGIIEKHINDATNQFNLRPNSAQLSRQPTLIKKLTQQDEIESAKEIQIQKENDFSFMTLVENELSNIDTTKLQDVSIDQIYNSNKSFIPDNQIVSSKDLAFKNQEYLSEFCIDKEEDQQDLRNFQKEENNQVQKSLVNSKQDTIKTQKSRIKIKS